MTRRGLVWLLSVPLMLGGVESGHWLAYRVAYPDPYVRGQALASSGHGYLENAPLFFAVAGALALCAFWSRSFGRGGPVAAGTDVSLLPFVLLAPLAFGLQECVERLFVGGWPFSAMLEPTFIPGLAFQLPFAFAAFLLARWLLRAADRLRLLFLDGARPVPVLLAARVLGRFAVVDLPRAASLATCHGERGPPGTVSATLVAVSR
jgi:hypothetical protein